MVLLRYRRRLVGGIRRLTIALVEPFPQISKRTKQGHHFGRPRESAGGSSRDTRQRGTDPRRCILPTAPRTRGNIETYINIQATLYAPTLYLPAHSSPPREAGSLPAKALADPLIATVVAAGAAGAARRARRARPAWRRVSAGHRPTREARDPGPLKRGLWHRRDDRTPDGHCQSRCLQTTVTAPARAMPFGVPVSGRPGWPGAAQSYRSKPSR